MNSTPEQPRACSGFTLVELMISLGILLLALAAIVPISIFFLKSNYSLGNYVSMTNQSRFFTEQLGTDLKEEHTGAPNGGATSIPGKNVSGNERLHLKEQKSAHKNSSGIHMLA